MLYRSRKLPLVILTEMKHHFCRRRSILKGYVQPVELEELDPCRLKLPLLHRHIVDVSKFVIPSGSGGERPHTTDGAITNELWCYKTTEYYGVVRAGSDIN